MVIEGRGDPGAESATVRGMRFEVVAGVFRRVAIQTHYA